MPNRKAKMKSADAAAKRYKGSKTTRDVKPKGKVSFKGTNPFKKKFKVSYKIKF